MVAVSVILDWPVLFLMNTQARLIKEIDQFRYVKNPPKTIDLSSRLWKKTIEFVGFLRASY